MNNWFEIAVGLYLAAMILYGHYRGFLRMAVSMAAVIISLAIVHIVLPPAIVFVKNETPIVHWIEEGLEQTLIHEEDLTGLTERREAIEGLNLPEEFQELLIESSTDFQESLSGYISSCLTELIINVVGFAVLFALVYVGLHLIMRCLDIMAKLPIISGVNKIAGAFLGGLQGILFLWILFGIIAAFSQNNWAGNLILQIKSSKWLTFLYQNNLLFKIVLGLMKGMFQ